MVIVDVDKGPDLSSYFKIKSVPTMYSFVKGEIAESLIGANKDEIVHFFKSTLTRLGF